MKHLEIIELKNDKLILRKYLASNYLSTYL